MNDYSVNNIIDTLADFIEPITGTVWQAQDNRDAMPKGEFCILTPLRFTRLSTARGIHNDTGNPETSAMNWTEIRQADIQLDIYGASAGNRAIAIETLFASAYGYEAIQSLDERLAPLYSSAALQTSMINSEGQWEERYTLTLSLQAHIIVTVPQDYFDKADIQAEQADK